MASTNEDVSLAHDFFGSEYTSNSDRTQLGACEGIDPSIIQDLLLIWSFDDFALGEIWPCDSDTDNVQEILRKEGLLLKEVRSNEGDIPDLLGAPSVASGPSEVLNTEIDTDSLHRSIRRTGLSALEVENNLEVQVLSDSRTSLPSYKIQTTHNEEITHTALLCNSTPPHVSLIHLKPALYNDYQSGINLIGDNNTLCSKWEYKSEASDDIDAYFSADEIHDTEDEDGTAYRISEHPPHCTCRRHEIFTRYASSFTSSIDEKEEKALEEALGGRPRTLPLAWLSGIKTWIKSRVGSSRALRKEEKLRQERRVFYQPLHSGSKINLNEVSLEESLEEFPLETPELALNIDKNIREEPYSSLPIATSKVLCELLVQVPQEIKPCRLLDQDGLHTQNMPRDSPQPFQCTFCLVQYDSKEDWAEHEKGVHIKQKGWTCLLNSPVKEVYDRTVCAFCGIVEPGHSISLHNTTVCADKMIEDRTFMTKGDIEQHLRSVHNHKDGITSMIQSWEWPEVMNDWYWNCGFCEVLMQSWDQRQEHIASEHFEKGETMASWTPLRSPYPVHRRSFIPVFGFPSWSPVSLLAIQKSNPGDHAKKAGEKKKLLQCLICGIVFADFAASRQHMKLWHAHPNSWTCPSLAKIKDLNIFFASVDNTDDEEEEEDKERKETLSHDEHDGKSNVTDSELEPDFKQSSLDFCVCCGVDFPQDLDMRKQHLSEIHAFDNPDIDCSSHKFFREEQFNAHVANVHKVGIGYFVPYAQREEKPLSLIVKGYENVSTMHV